MNGEDPFLLIQEAKKGNKEAFTQLYNLYFTPIYRYIYFQISNKEDVDDLVQLVFVKVYKALPNLPEMQKSPIAYFYTVARNTIIDYRRKNKHKVASFETIEFREKDSDNSLADTIEQKERLAQVQQAMEQLNEEQREVVLLRFIEERSVREAAQIMDKSEEAVRQLQCRALKKLRSYLPVNVNV